MDCYQCSVISFMRPFKILELNVMLHRLFLSSLNANLYGTIINTSLFSSMTVKCEKIKFLVIALRDSVEIYAWAPKPYHKFMAFKSFTDLMHKPLLVDMTIEEGIRLKVIYGSKEGFHAVDLDNGHAYDIYVPAHVRVHFSTDLLRYFSFFSCFFFA